MEVLGPGRQPDQLAVVIQLTVKKWRTVRRIECQFYEEPEVCVCRYKPAAIDSRRTCALTRCVAANGHHLKRGLGTLRSLGLARDDRCRHHGDGEHEAKDRISHTFALRGLAPNRRRLFQEFAWADPAQVYRMLRPADEALVADLSKDTSIDEIDQYVKRRGRSGLDAWIENAILFTTQLLSEFQ
jgi:hypothetical protein